MDFLFFIFSCSFCWFLFFALLPRPSSQLFLFPSFFLPFFPPVNASWYTGRGIRPLGRFGRKAARRNELLAFITARVYRPTADSGVWITQ
uniref:Uncharacterized protein n=1 Tax=Maylandia zebra TaxID=106582 RepID=A0A3P9C814_9CICH